MPDYPEIILLIYFP